MKHIFLVGYMGSGKSTVGKALAEKLAYPFIDTDVVLEKQYGLSISEIFEQKGENHFRESELRFLIDFNPTKACVVATGGGMPCDVYRMSLIKDISLSFYLYLPSGKIVERLWNGENTRPLIGGMTSKKQLSDHVKKEILKREQFYFQADYICQAEASVESILEDIIEKIALH
jgi:shikimate kinase